jgi:hypothetical protein
MPIVSWNNTTVGDFITNRPQDLAHRYGSHAKCSHRSFIPDGFDISFSDEYEITRTVIDMPSGYDAIDMELREFDLVYGFPWPEEHAFFRTIHDDPRRKGD